MINATMLAIRVSSKGQGSERHQSLHLSYNYLFVIESRGKRQDAQSGSYCAKAKGKLIEGWIRHSSTLANTVSVSESASRYRYALLVSQA